MTKLYLLKFSHDKENEINIEIDSFPDSVKEKIINTADKKTKTERIYTYGFLFYILASIGFSSEKIKKSFDFTEKGKPYMKDSDINISVSHSDGIAVLALSSEGKIGIDAEKVDLSKNEQLEKIIRRFCPDLKVLYNENVIIPQLFCTEKNSFIDYGKPKFETVSKENENFVKWTALESALKCHGGGFSALCEKDTVLNSVTISSGIISIEKDSYAISVSESIKE